MRAFLLFGSFLSHFALECFAQEADLQQASLEEQAVANADPQAWQQVEVTDFFATHKESAEEFQQRMNWFEDARFGMFIHWGLYSEAGGEFPGKEPLTNGGQEWIQNRLQIPAQEYQQELIPRFNPVDYDPEQWAEIAAEAGMRYVVITSRHHDGFCLWPSQYTDLDTSSTPYQEDLLSPLATAVREQGLHFGLYYSILDWGHPAYGKEFSFSASLTQAGGNPDMEVFTAFLKNQLLELQIQYQPDVFWFDGEWDDCWTHERGIDLYNYCRSLNPSALINNRVDKGRRGMAGMTNSGFAGDFGTPEQEIPETGFGPGVYWESCMTMNNTWGYGHSDNNWKSTEQLLQNLVDTASKGGNYLLNIGPDGNGRIPEESITRLREIGAWMNINQEAIYGTRATPFAEIAFNGRITVKDQADGNSILYCHLFDWPEKNTLHLPKLPDTVAPNFAYLLCTPDLELDWSTEESSNTIVLQLGEQPSDQTIPVVAIELNQHLNVQITETAPNEDSNEEIDLNAAAGLE